jgi:hypothetical protein
MNSVDGTYNKQTHFVFNLQREPKSPYHLIKYTGLFSLYSYLLTVLHNQKMFYTDNVISVIRLSFVTSESLYVVLAVNKGSILQ